jgi:hypothetical protein
MESPLVPLTSSISLGIWLNNDIWVNDLRVLLYIFIELSHSGRTLLF